VYSVPVINAILAADDTRCLLQGPREALRKAVAEAGRRHLLYAHRLRLAARDMFVAVQRGEYTRASLLVGGQLALKRSSSTGTTDSVGAASYSLKALASIGAGRATFGVSRRRSSAGSAVSTTSALERENPASVPAGSAETAAIAAAGLGTLQVRFLLQFVLEGLPCCDFLVAFASRSLSLASSFAWHLCVPMQLDPRLPVRVTMADLPDMLAAAGITLPDDTELRSVYEEYDVR
jgi:hypothetical protein